MNSFIRGFLQRTKENQPVMNNHQDNSMSAMNRKRKQPDLAQKVSQDPWLALVVLQGGVIE